MADDAIAAAEIAAGAVGSSEIDDLAIVNADISASAAIADTKLDTIATAGKVSGAAITLLTSLPAGAGVIPSANLPSSVQTLFIAAESSAGAWVEDSTVTVGVQMDDAAATEAYCHVFIPSSATITSIIMVANSGAGQANTAVFDYTAISFGPAAARVTDSTLGVSVTQWSVTDQIEHITIPSTVYDGLSKGIPWIIKAERKGAHASDNLTTSLFVHGFLFTLA